MSNYYNELDDIVEGLYDMLLGKEVAGHMITKSILRDILRTTSVDRCDNCGVIVREHNLHEKNTKGYCGMDRYYRTDIYCSECYKDISSDDE